MKGDARQRVLGFDFFGLFIHIFVLENVSIRVSTTGENFPGGTIPLATRLELILVLTFHSDDMLHQKPQTHGQNPW